MAFVPYNGTELPNLVNVTKRLDPDGKIARIAEILNQNNPILEDIPLVEGNLPTGHRTTVRADLPEPTWRKLNYGVRPGPCQPRRNLPAYQWCHQPVRWSTWSAERHS